MVKWVADKNASPPIYPELKAGRKTVATVRRVRARRTKTGWRYSYQVVTRYVDIVGGAVGPIFPSLVAAKRHAEQR